MYTAAYLRVSTGQQKTDSQRQVLTHYVRTHRVKNVKWMQDKRSGRTTKRPQLQRLIDDCRAGRCSCILLYRLDRLARNTRATLALFDELISLKVKVVCVSQGLVFDNSATSKLMLTLWAGLAEHESDVISERTKAGLAVARANRKRLGAAPDQRKRNKLSRMKDKGLSLDAMAQATGTTRQSVHAMLKRIIKAA